jgi:hypothetical protein
MKQLIGKESTCLTSLLGPSLAVVKDTKLGLTILSTSEMSATLSNPTQRLLRPQSVSEVHRSTYLALNTNLHVKFASVSHHVAIQK